ncbi:MAG: JAB domain-containing protein [Pseudomonadota bacterium]
MPIIRDFTHIETIYKKRIKAVSIKVKQDYVASDDIELQTIGNPNDVKDVLASIFQNLDDDQEHFILLVLNQAHDLTGYKLISSGAQSYSTADCKVLFRNALLLGASAIILAHNHPSGSLTPSGSDIAVTKKIIEAADLLDIEVVDHVIYSSKGCLSLKAERPEIFD